MPLDGVAVPSVELGWQVLHSGPHDRFILTDEPEFRDERATYLEQEKVVLQARLTNLHLALPRLVSRLGTRRRWLRCLDQPPTA